MTDLLERAAAVVMRGLPAADRDPLAQAILALTTRETRSSSGANSRARRKSSRRSGDDENDRLPIATIRHAARTAVDEAA